MKKALDSSSESKLADVCPSVRVGSWLVQFVSVGLLMASLATGAYLAQASRLQSQAWRTQHQQLIHKSASVVSERTSHYVQEPAERTSFRPDFSSGMRRAHQRSNYAMLRAFNDAVADVHRCTVLVTSAGQQVALGAIVDPNGWVVTKASQLPSEGEIQCHLYDRSVISANVIERVLDVDLALLKIEKTGLPAIPWELSQVPQRGAWLATTDVDRMPTAVGVVSAGVQSVQPAKAVLGVEVVESTAGAAIIRVLKRTGAYEAGLRVGDNIISVNDMPVSSHRSLQAALNPRLEGKVTPAWGGQIVKLKVSRGERVFDASVRLMDLSEELLDETEMEVNGLVSARATGFSRVFLHDTVLEPNQCGGPVCNLDGKVVGLNIARAGRVASYALPSDVVRPVLEGLIAQATLVSRPAKQELGSVR